MEGQLGGLSDQRLQALRITEAGRLDQDAVVALPLDRRLGGAQFVDAAVDDLDRLLDDTANPLCQAGVGIDEADQTIVGDSQVELIDRAATNQNSY